MFFLALVLVLSNSVTADEGESVSPSQQPISLDRSEVILEAVYSLKSQVATSTLYMKDTRRILDKVNRRLNKMEDKLEELEDKLDAVDVSNCDVEELEKKIDEKLDSVVEIVEASQDLLAEVRTDVKVAGSVLTEVNDNVSRNGELTSQIKSRQETSLTEVRLISLYKMSDQTSQHQGGGGGHGSGLAVDGQFVYSHWDPNSPVRTINHLRQLPDQKLSIDLGALFRIYRVSIWNARHCGSGCRDRFIGTRIYLDEKLLATAVSGEFIYNFLVPDVDATYAKSVTLHQPSGTTWLHVVEVQVWGTGPFSLDDKFA